MQASMQAARILGIIRCVESEIIRQMYPSVIIIEIGTRFELNALSQ